MKEDPEKKIRRAAEAFCLALKGTAEEARKAGETMARGAEACRKLAEAFQKRGGDLS